MPRKIIQYKMSNKTMKKCKVWEFAIYHYMEFRKIKFCSVWSTRSPPAGLDIILSMKITLNCIYFYSPPQPRGAHSRCFMKVFKAALEPFGTSGWQPPWKLKHIPLLCKLGLAAVAVHRITHTAGAVWRSPEQEDNSTLNRIKVDLSWEVVTSWVFPATQCCIWNNHAAKAAQFCSKKNL